MCLCGLLDVITIERRKSMVKFSRELEAQLIPEWKDKFVDYRQHVKKIKLALHRSSVPPPPPLLCSSSSSTEIGSPVREPTAATVTEDAIISRNGVSFLALAAHKAKALKKAGRLRTATTLRIDIPPTTPARAISMVWEDLVNSSSSRKEGGDCVNRKKLQRAEKMIREAFVHLYRGLGLLKTYSVFALISLHAFWHGEAAESTITSSSILALIVTKI